MASLQSAGVGAFSASLRAARLRHRLTQAQLAAQIGVSQGTISFWENGVETPTVEHLIALALALPEIIESVGERERVLLQRILKLERELFEGRCACRSCGCVSNPASAQVVHPPPVREKGESPMKIAVTGKGGVGKTTIAGILARTLARSGRQVLALDGDSNPNLAFSLGVSREQLAGLTVVPPGLTEWREDAHGKAYVHLRLPVDQLIDRYAIPAPDGVRLMIMGEVVQASVGCRCEAHAVARGITGHLLTGNGSGDASPGVDVVILDMEAGLEHLGRGTAEHVDLLLIVVEPYYRALEAARRIRDLALQLQLPRIWVIGNRVRTPQEERAIAQFCQRHQLELATWIPFDEAVLAGEEAGLTAVDYAPDCPAVQAVAQFGRQLLEMGVSA